MPIAVTHVVANVIWEARDMVVVNTSVQDA